MEKWPYPSVPVYVVCPKDGKGCSQTLHRNYLLPISPNIGQDVKGKPMAGVGDNNASTPVPPWIVSLLMQDHPGQSHQVQQVAHPRVVWISLLHLDVVCGKPGTAFHGDTGILVYRQIPAHLTSGMCGLVYVSVSMPYSVCILISGRKFE